MSDEQFVAGFNELFDLSSRIYTQDVDQARIKEIRDRMQTISESMAVDNAVMALKAMEEKMMSASQPGQSQQPMFKLKTKSGTAPKV